MTAREKRAKLAAMRQQAREYDRIGDVVLRDQMLRSIEEAKVTWRVPVAGGQGARQRRTT